MTDPADPGRPEPGGQEEALLRFLSQFGITPGPDGRLDLDQLLARMQTMMGAFTTQMEGFARQRDGANVLSDNEIEQAIDEINLAIKKYSRFDPGG